LVKKRSKRTWGKWGGFRWDSEGEAVSSVIHTYGSTEIPHIPLDVMDQPCWYAVHTRSQHEKRVEARLLECGISTFLPVVKQVRRWSDRRKVIEMPLFSCYVFVQIIPSAKTRVTVLRTEGVIGFVGVRGEGTPVRDREIEGVRLLLSRGAPFAPYPFLKMGQRVRIRGGSLDGLEGVIVGGRGNRQLVVSVDLIQRSIAVTVEGYDIEAV
jgi:transcription antitermination factor NusG